MTGLCAFRETRSLKFEGFLDEISCSGITAKAKTINKYLGKDYKVLASYGHIRDLPSKDGSVDPEKDFSMVWELSSGGKKRLNDIIAALKDCDTLVLASDPDREGEAIAWHILEELSAKKKLKDKNVHTPSMTIVYLYKVLQKYPECNPLRILRLEYTSNQS